MFSTKGWKSTRLSDTRWRLGHTDSRKVSRTGHYDHNPTREIATCPKCDFRNLPHTRAHQRPPPFLASRRLHAPRIFNSCSAIEKVPRVMHDEWDGRRPDTRRNARSVGFSRSQVFTKTSSFCGTFRTLPQLGIPHAQVECWISTDPFLSWHAFGALRRCSSKGSTQGDD